MWPDCGLLANIRGPLDSAANRLQLRELILGLTSRGQPALTYVLVNSIGAGKGLTDTEVRCNDEAEAALSQESRNSIERDSL